MLIFIILLAAVLRLWQLGNVPPSPDWDEVALGYNAYSIMQTGKDEYGKFLPLILRSYDDYKPALYTYLIIPSISIFGLNVFAVRLPSAILGILSTLAVFYLIMELFEEYRYRDKLSLLGSFLFAVSPWSLQFSRVGFEANAALAFNIFCALFFLKGLKRPILLYFSAIFAVLSVYSYQSEKVFLPLIILSLAIIYRKELLDIQKKYLIGSFILGLILILPMFLYLLGNSSSLQRAKSTSIFSYQSPIMANIQKLDMDIKNSDTLGLILDNRRFVYVKEIISGYLSHFDPNWLFITGDIPRHHAPGMGLLYLFEFPFILIGIYELLFGNFNKKTKLVIFAWLLIAPIPAAFTFEVPHAVRTLNFLPTWQIFSSLGIFVVFLHLSKLKAKIFGYLILALFFAVFIFNFVYYLDQYFVQMNYYNFRNYNTSLAWQYGYKEAIWQVQNILKTKNYKEVVVSNKEPMDQSYMFFLFYLKYPPAKYQNKSINHSFSNFVFRNINWQKDSQIKNVLYVGTPQDIPSDAQIIKKIYNLDGSVAIILAET
jgi:4-amino-4-deoxy-L-arabinose transferase-like glycosyltransferase